MTASCACGERARYKCPRCGVEYCSVGCFRSHKDVCAGPQEIGAAGGASEARGTGETDADEIDLASPWATALQDGALRQMLKQRSLREHLGVVARILEDSSVSGEATADGRWAVALKKLREMRKGGREQNELVEDFVQRVVALCPTTGRPASST